MGFFGTEIAYIYVFKFLQIDLRIVRTINAVDCNSRLVEISGQIEKIVLMWTHIVGMRACSFSANNCCFVFFPLRKRLRILPMGEATHKAYPLMGCRPHKTLICSICSVY